MHIPSLARLRALQEQHLISVHKMDDLIICNYTERCQFTAAWDEDTMACRGLILGVDNGWPGSNRITEVVALPFAKFFNIGEGGRSPVGELLNVTEKIDGSLGILYWHKGTYRVATRGTFDSKQALWATEYLSRYSLRGLLAECTLLFEIVYPKGRIVVDYGKRQDLVLIGVRDRISGIDFGWTTVAKMAEEFGFNTPQVYGMTSIDTVLTEAKHLGPNAEGYVLRFDDGTRFKVKGDVYRTIAKLRSHISQKHVIEAMQAGTLDTWIESLPGEFQTEVIEWRDQARANIKDIVTYTKRAFAQAPKNNRRDFALWAQANHSTLAPLLFNLLDGRDIMPGVYKMLLGGPSKQGA